MKPQNKQQKSLLTLALATVLSLVLSSCGSGDDASTPSDVDSAIESLPISENVVTVAEEIRDGVAFGDITVGDPDAPITIIEYFSMTCSHCADFHNIVLPTLEERWVSTGVVKFIYRNFIRDGIDLMASMVARCEGPERAMLTTSLFFEKQNQWAFSNDPVGELAALARRAGISRASFDACLQNKELERHLVEMANKGRDEFNIEATPTFFINGEKIEGALPLEEFDEMIREKR